LPANTSFKEYLTNAIFKINIALNSNDYKTEESVRNQINNYITLLKPNIGNVSIYFRVYNNNYLPKSNEEYNNLEGHDIENKNVVTIRGQADLNGISSLKIN